MAKANINVVDGNGELKAIYPTTTIDQVTGLQTVLDSKVDAENLEVTSADDGKVLKASFSGGVGSYSWETESGGGGGGSGVTAVKVGNNGTTYYPDSNGVVTTAEYSTNDHSHGSLARDGSVSTSGVTIGSGDRLLIADYSNSDGLRKSSITFDGSTTSKALTQAGTWGTFLTSHQSLSGYVPTSRTINGYSLSSNRTLDYSDVGAAPYSHSHSNASTSSSGFMSSTDKTILGKVPWSHTSTTFSASTANAWQYTGLSFSVPGGTLYEFIIMNKGTGSGATPLGIIVGDISTGFDTSGARFIIAENSFTSAKSNDNVWVRSLHGMTPVGYTSGSKTWYVWVKNKTTGTHAIDVFYRPIYY